MYVYGMYTHVRIWYVRTNIHTNQDEVMLLPFLPLLHKALQASFAIACAS